MVQIPGIMERKSFGSFFLGMRNSKSARLRPKQLLEAVILEVVAAAVAEAVSTVVKKVICPG